MGLLRTAIVRGPATIIYAGITFWTPDDITVSLDDGFQDVTTQMFGKVDGLLVNPKITVNFTPQAHSDTLTFAQVCAVLIPAIFTNGYKGTALLGSGSEVPCVIWGSDGTQLTLSNAVITKPPQLILSADKPLFGQMTMTGLCKTTSSDIDLGQADALYDLVTGAANPGEAYAGLPAYLQRRYQGNLGTQTGFTSIWPEGGWTVDFNPSWKERTIQGLVVDFELTEMEIMAKCVPTGPTMLQVADLVGVGGNTAWAQGAHLSAQQTTHDLTIKDGAGTTVFTLNKPVLRNPGFAFGQETLRVGELGFHSLRRFTGGVVAPLAAW